MVWLAVTVAFGRVYAGVHLPLDVVGGAGLGLLCGTLARWAFGLGGEGLPVAPAAGTAAVSTRGDGPQIRLRRWRAWKDSQPGRIGSQNVAIR